MIILASGSWLLASNASKIPVTLRITVINVMRHESGVCADA